MLGCMAACFNWADSYDTKVSIREFCFEDHRS
jgi:hypothetical protein